MPVLLAYVLKITTCYFVVYLFYVALLKRLTCYTANRYFLLSASVLALLLPLARLDLFIAPATLNTSRVISIIPSVNAALNGHPAIAQQEGHTFSSLLLVIYISGVALCLFRLILQFRSLQRIKAAATRLDSRGQINIYHLDREVIPFSFGNNIYVNTNLHTPAEMEEIILHESVHVRQRHTLDVLMAEGLCILNWFNPFAWLIRHTIKQNLEFLADDAVIQNRTDKKSYQYLLLKVLGYAPLTISTGLNVSSLKQRIYMMNKNRTSNKHLLKFLLAVPLVVTMLIAFRNKTSNATANIKTDTQQETFKLGAVRYSVNDARIARIVQNEHTGSYLQVGKPFSIATIKNERDRLKSLLEKNGYNNITEHSISFLIDSSLTNNSFSIQVNIDLSKMINPGVSRSTAQQRDPTISQPASAYNDDIHPVALQYAHGHVGNIYPPSYSRSTVQPAELRTM